MTSHGITCVFEFVTLNLTSKLVKVIVWFRDSVKVMVRKGAWLKLAPFGITKMAAQVTFDVASNENSQGRGHGRILLTPCAKSTN